LDKDSASRSFSGRLDGEGTRKLGSLVTPWKKTCATISSLDKISSHLPETTRKSRKKEEQKKIRQGVGVLRGWTASGVSRQGPIVRRSRMQQNSLRGVLKQMKRLGTSPPDPVMRIMEVKLGNILRVGVGKEMEPPKRGVRGNLKSLNGKTYGGDMKTGCKDFPLPS